MLTGNPSFRILVLKHPSRIFQVDAAVRSGTSSVDLVKLSFHAGGYMDHLANFCAATPLLYYRQDTAPPPGIVQLPHHIQIDCHEVMRHV